MFDNLKIDDSVKVEEEKDSLGGSFVLESDAYNLILNAVYTSKSSGGATAVNIVASTPDGQQFKHTEYVTNKKGEPTYKDKKTGEKRPLPGLSTINSITKLVTGKLIHELQSEDKVLNIYDYESKKELPTTVPCATELHGKGITLGILKQVENKNVKDANGNYVPTADTRELNTISKAFRASDKLTNAEIASGATEHEFYDKWVEKNKGRVVDKSKKIAGGGTSGAPKPPTASEDNPFAD